MIDDKDLAFELDKQLILTREAWPNARGLSEFIWHYGHAYKRLTPEGVLFDDVREAAVDAMFDTPLDAGDDAILPWAGAHLLLVEAGLTNDHVGDFKSVEESRPFLEALYAKLPERVEDELVASMEELFGAKVRGFGELASHHHRRAANVVICTRFYLQLVLQEQPAAKAGAFLAVAHTGIRFMMEGAAVIKHFERFKRAE